MPAIVTVSLADYLLILTGKAQAKNVSFTIANSVTVTDHDNALTPNGSDPYVFIHTIQFDGVQSGQVGYNFDVGDGSTVAGYAIQGVPEELNMFSRAPVRYQIQNGQSTSCVVNIDYFSVPDEVYKEVITSLTNQIGGRFGGLAAK